MLRTSDYDYDLPAGSIAQTPAERRDASRLMVLRRETATIEHRTFADLAEMIPPGDVLVRNTTRVFRARLLGTRDSGAPAEIFLLRPLGGDLWEAMVHPGGKLHSGRTVRVGDRLDVEIVEVTERRTRIVRLWSDMPAQDAIEQYGHVPLPPYIARPDTPADAGRYQTVYAAQSGSVAAPTAGLHFTPELLAGLEKKGVRFADIVLHVGAGTFKPVSAESVGDHVMHEEWFDIPQAAADTINAARAAGHAIWSVGTTSLRALESALQPDRTIRAGSGETRIFIHPPRVVQAVDHLITNFHLPRSTLLMLVAAFAGYELTMRAYAEAVRSGYRFYSYGDAMVVVLARRQRTEDRRQG